MDAKRLAEIRQLMADRSKADHWNALTLRQAIEDLLEDRDAMANQIKEVASMVPEIVRAVIDSVPSIIASAANEKPECQHSLQPCRCGGHPPDSSLVHT